jgi:hypothetical protein
MLFTVEVSYANDLCGIIDTLSLTLAVIAGLNLPSTQVKHVLRTVASAVWGS